MSPHDGGCWYCHGAEGDLLFSMEFDTNVHESCLLGVLKDDPKDPEAAVMARELLESAW